MEGPQYILSLIGALGGGLTVREIVGAIGRSKSGKMKTDRLQAKSLVARTRYAEAVAEYERNYRVIIQDHASTCRRVAMEYGAHVTELGVWPLPPPAPKRPDDEPDKSTI